MIIIANKVNTDFNYFDHKHTAINIQIVCIFYELKC